MNHLTETQIRAFAARTLTPTELLEADDHLTSCDQCKATMLTAAPNDASIASLRMEFRKAEPHLGRQQIHALAAGDEVQAVAKLHLAHCNLCTNEVADLKRFIDEQPARLRSPFQAKRQTIVSRLFHPGWVSLAAAAVLLIAVGLIFLRVNSATNTTATNSIVPAVAAPAVNTAPTSPGTPAPVQHNAPAKLNSSALADLVLPVYPMHMLRGNAIDPQFTKGMAAYQTGNCSKTVVELANVNDAAPESHAAYFYSGSCLLHLRKYDAALAALRKVADAGDTPEQEPALYEMAQVALAQNNPALAHRYLSQTIALRGDLETQARAQDARVQTLLAH